MDYYEILKRLKWFTNWNFWNRRILLAVLIFLVLFLYLGPILFKKILHFPKTDLEDSVDQVLQLHLDNYANEVGDFDVHVRHVPPIDEEKSFIAYVGNGYIGLEVDHEALFMLKETRTLSRVFNYSPIVQLTLEGFSRKESLITRYKSGIVERVEVWQTPSMEPLKVVYSTYAHRTNPSILIQDIKVVNHGDLDVFFNVDRRGATLWQPLSSKTVLINHGNDQRNYVVLSGSVEVPRSSSSSPSSVIAVTLATLDLPSSIQARRKHTTTFRVVTSLNYSEPVKLSQLDTFLPRTELGSLEALRSIVNRNSVEVESTHLGVWGKLWSSGLTISHSKAENAVNGDLINATLYYVMSQSRAFLHESKIDAEEKKELSKKLAYSEGCYDEHDTFQAKTLWSNLDSLADVNKVVSLWLLTLEKQGCHQLLRVGVDGVLQAMLLSFGSFRFSNQHLEYNVDPSHLHRDYFFRRVNYGLETRLNISVAVQDDYKAVLSVAVEGRPDKVYYGCDAGCLDSPVQLGLQERKFPVKKTAPLTAILYVTSDKDHMVELKHTIHVREIAVAPPHEQHVIAIHRHGHKWGGLPSLFWLVIVTLIVVFHLFLFKIIVNEYCGGSFIKGGVKYRKFSDFE